MKKLCFLPLLLLCLNAFSQNVPRKSAEERAEMLVQSLVPILTLSEDQALKIKAIQLETLIKADELRTKAREAGDPKLVRDEMKKVNEASELSIKALLTSEQAIKYDAWLVKRKEEMKNRNGNGG